MIRKIAAILLILVFLLPTLLKVSIYVDFKIHQDFIIEMFCINKDKPLVMCSGSCYLADKLEKADEGQKKESPVKIELRNELVYYQISENKKNIDPDDSVLNRFPSTTQWFKPSDHLDKIFRPPKLINV